VVALVQVYVGLDEELGEQDGLGGAGQGDRPLALRGLLLLGRDVDLGWA
jgi:hypothetical protein